MFNLFKKEKSQGDYKKMFLRLKDDVQRVWYTYDHCPAHDNLINTLLGKDIEKMKKDLDDLISISKKSHKSLAYVDELHYKVRYFSLDIQFLEFVLYFAKIILSLHYEI